MSDHFGQIVVGDFEYETSGGEYNLVAGDLPVVLCGVFYVLDENLQHVRTIKQWRGEFGSTPPFDIGDDTLFVAYSAWAELTCFMTLRWKFPKHVYDLHTAYLATSNILTPHDPDNPRKREHKRLPDACRAYGIEGWEQIDKGTMAQDIGEGRWRKYGQPPSSNIARRMFASHRATGGAIARAQIVWRRQASNMSCIGRTTAPRRSRGFRRAACRSTCLSGIWCRRTRRQIIRSLLRRFDPSQGSDAPIYTPEGEWSYARFEQYLVRAGIAAWPRLESGQLDIDGDAFRLMYHAPGIEGLHALRDSLGVVVRAKLPIGRDGRNRPSLFPFCTATGRNAHAKSLYNAHAGMRSFMVVPAGYDRGLSRLAHPGSRDSRLPQ